jgi:hypothetical protein
MAKIIKIHPQYIKSLSGRRGNNPKEKILGSHRECVLWQGEK